METKIFCERPLVIFDLETTGVNVNRDRIVEIAAIRIEGDQIVSEFETRVNPQCAIPPGSTQIHGITDRDVMNSPTLAEIGDQIHELFDGADLGGFNSSRFDVPLLEAEMKRICRDLDLRSRNQIDVLTIFRAKRPKTLSGVYREYTGEVLDDAHQAMNDVIATWKILQAQAEAGEVPRNTKDLLDEMKADHTATGKNYADPVGRKFLIVDGKPIATFGKHSGKPLELLARNERGFLSWMLRNTFDEDTLSVVRAALQKRLEPRK